MKKALSILLALCLMLGALAACGNDSNDTPNDGGSGGNGGGQGGNVIYFGVNYELTGANPIIGESAIKGIDMAVDEINAAGGVTVNGTAYHR